MLVSWQGQGDPPPGAPKGLTAKIVLIAFDVTVRPTLRLITIHHPLPSVRRGPPGAALPSHLPNRTQIVPTAWESTYPSSHHGVVYAVWVVTPGRDLNIPRSFGKQQCCITNEAGLRGYQTDASTQWCSSPVLVEMQQMPISLSRQLVHSETSWAMDVVPGVEEGGWIASLYQPRLPGTHRGTLPATITVVHDYVLGVNPLPVTQARKHVPNTTPPFSAQPSPAAPSQPLVWLQSPSAHPPEPLLPSHDKPGAVRQGNRFESRRLASPLEHMAYTCIHSTYMATPPPASSSSSPTSYNPLPHGSVYSTLILFHTSKEPHQTCTTQYTHPLLGAAWLGHGHFTPSAETGQPRDTRTVGTARVSILELPTARVPTKALTHGRQSVLRPLPPPRTSLVVALLGSCTDVPLRTRKTLTGRQPRVLPY